MTDGLVSDVNFKYWPIQCWKMVNVSWIFGTGFLPALPVSDRTHSILLLDAGTSRYETRVVIGPRRLFTGTLTL